MRELARPMLSRNLAFKEKRHKVVAEGGARLEEVSVVVVQDGRNLSMAGRMLWRPEDRI